MEAVDRRLHFVATSKVKQWKWTSVGSILYMPMIMNRTMVKQWYPPFARNVEHVQSRRKLCLKGNAINELPTNGCPLELDSLCLRECKNLERLPSSICELKSLTYLNLAYCTKLVSLPESICNLSSLKFLNVSFCTKLEKFPENLRSLQCLKRLYASGTAIEELPSSFEHLQGLQCLKLARCDSLVSLPESICNLSSLRTLDVSFCTKLEKFPENLRSLQCLKHLYPSGLNLSMDCFRSILVGIIQLSKLRNLDLSHCRRVPQVPDLPRSLRYLDVHSCTCLETLSSPSSQLGFSLFKCFKSMIEVWFS